MTSLNHLLVVLRHRIKPLTFKQKDFTGSLLHNRKKKTKEQITNDVSHGMDRSCYKYNVKNILICERYKKKR